MTVSEMYFASCARVEDTLRCGVCGVDTVHESQSRMFTAPNVLVVQVRRRAGPRVAVGVEEQLDVPGLPVMELAGVVYHNGRTFQEGHYMALCRGPGGRFWFYDDNRPVLRRPEEVAHIRPRQVYMLVYCRRDGSATWQRRAAVADCVDLDGVDGGDDEGRRGRRDAEREGDQNVSEVSGRAFSSSGHLPAASQEVESPKRRRLTSKKSCEGSKDAALQVDESPRRGCGVVDSKSVYGRSVGSPLIREATTPERVAKASRVGSAATVDEMALSPRPDAAAQRADVAMDGEAQSVVPAGVGEAASSAVQSLASLRRLRRKVSSSAGSPARGASVHEVDASQLFGARTPNRIHDSMAVGDAGATPRRAGTPPHRLRSKTPTRVGSPVLDGACVDSDEALLHAAGSGMPQNQLRGVTDEAGLAEAGRGQSQRTAFARGSGGRGQSRGMSGQGKGRGRGQHGAGALTEEHAAAAPRRSARVAALAAEQLGDAGRR